MSEVNGKTGFFEEKPGNKSHMRLMSFLVFWLLVVIDVLLLKFSYYSEKPFDNYFVWFMLGINFLFLISIFYPKYLQKILEIGISKAQQIQDAVSKVLPVKDTEIKP
jgi:magnesium-transporting ATPase (P-type)